MSIWHWSVFVKKRSNEVRVDCHEEEGDEDSEEPEIDEEVVSAPVDDLDDGGQDWRLDHLTNQELLDLILHVETWSLLVETMLLFKNKFSVNTERQSWNNKYSKFIIIFVPQST